MKTGDPIYTLTVLRKPERAPGGNPRTWTWFPDYDAAVKSLHEDTEFYFEIGYYAYALIEQVYSHSMGPHEQKWFKVDYIEESDAKPGDPYRYTITRLDGPPEEFRHVVNWSIG